MKVLLLLDDGWTAERIAEALCIDAETVREHRRRYEAGDVASRERLADQGSDPALNDGQRDILKQEPDAHLYMRAKAVCALVQRRFGVAYTPNAMTKLLKRLGFVYKKPKCMPAKADAAVQGGICQRDIAAADGSGRGGQPAVVRGRHASGLHGTSGVALIVS